MLFMCYYIFLSMPRSRYIYVVSIRSILLFFFIFIRINHITKYYYQSQSSVTYKNVADKKRVYIAKNQQTSMLYSYQLVNTTHKFSINSFFGKCEKKYRKLQICSHLLKKSSLENFIFCAVKYLNSVCIHKSC